MKIETRYHLKQPYINKKKPLFSFCLIIILCISLIGGCGRKESFEEFVDRLFKDEVTSNSINLHFTLENPKSYGIDEYEVTFGDFSKKGRTEQIEETKKAKLSLLSYPYLTLSDEDKLTYEILSDYLDTSLKLWDYEPIWRYFLLTMDYRFSCQFLWRNISSPQKKM